MAKVQIHILTNGLGIEAMCGQGSREARSSRGGTESRGREWSLYKVDNKPAITWQQPADV